MTAIQRDVVDTQTLGNEEKNTSLHKEAPNTLFGPPPEIAAWSPEERARKERQLRRKIDIRLLPLLILMYVLNYLDRNNIASARLGGLEADLNLVGSQYQVCVSILFVGYILMQVPSNMFLERIGKPAVYLPCCMVVWGIISTSTAACQNFGGLLACRFFLGFVEAAYFPGCLFFLSSWYTRKELAFRTAVLYSGSLLSGAFAGLIASGVVSGLDGAHGLRAWRWLFIIEGSITIGIAIPAIFVLPNFPATTKWLTNEERILAQWRLEEDAGETDEHGKSMLRGLKLAVKDTRLWVLMLMISCLVSAGSLTNFFPTIVQTLGYNNTVSLLLTVPPYALAVITTFCNSWHADRTGERTFHVVIPILFGLFSFILAAATTNTAARYVAMMFMPAGVYTGYVVGLAWISNSLPRPPAKRASALALINAVSNATQIYSSFLYLSSMSPRYVAAFAYNSATIVVAIACAFALRFMLKRLNAQLDRGVDVAGLQSAGYAAPTATTGGEAALPTAEARKRGFRFLY